MSGLSTAIIACRVCEDEGRLDDTNVVRGAQIAAFAAAHRHPEGFAVSMTVVATPVAEVRRLSARRDG